MSKFKHEPLVWIDAEMTGLDVTQHTIIEIAAVVTDSNLNIIANTPSYVIHQPQEELNKMDQWNVRTHTKSGLIKRVIESDNNTNDIEQQILQFITKFVSKNTSPMCGNTIYQDRKFIAKYMPELHDYFHYRNIDVSTIKELLNRWYPADMNQFKKNNAHEALVDILESIEELKYYRETFFNFLK